jgi:proline dehydrogenase
MSISFEDTAIAFAHKTTKELKKSRFLFKTMGKQWLVAIGTRLLPIAIQLKLPIKGIIRRTIFKQFVGGESLDATNLVTQKLNESKVDVILDYGVEAKEGEDAFEHTTEVFIKVIEYAATQPNIPFISIKVTGFARHELLEALAKAEGIKGKFHLPTSLKEEWSKVHERMIRICEAAKKNNIGVLVDAEESWIQDPVDRLTMEMMELYNTKHAVVFNTIQLYRHDRLAFMKICHHITKQKNIILGVKLVRGAYMEKERARADELNYENPIQPTKESSDKDYDAAIEYCIQHIHDICFIVATHNEESSMLTTTLMQQQNIPLHHAHVHFSQLYGMSDNITYNLAKAGCNVSKYLPFGPIHDVIPYLMRRAQENTSVSGQTGRELLLIEEELVRRKQEA